MGVKSFISLDEVNKLFTSYNFTKIIPTTDGIIDTTYILYDNFYGYILKRYERDVDIFHEELLLKLLNKHNLNVSKIIAQKNGWLLYKKLDGKVVKSINMQHIILLARFIAKIHKSCLNFSVGYNFLDKYDLDKSLNFCKNRYFFAYKKLQFMKNYNHENDGFIHGDIFKDNVVFHNLKVGIFDFIDGGDGSFVFDIAVSLISFSPKNKIEIYSDIFLKTYNQIMIKKVSKQTLKKYIKEAKGFYALVRIEHDKSIKRAKELL